jgi:hypothetical protein
MQRCPQPFVSGVDLGSFVYEEFYHLSLAFLNCVVQSTLTLGAVR